MSRIFHFRNESSGLSGYLKDLYLVLISFPILANFSLLFSGENFLLNTYTTFFYLGLAGIYWTPIVQRKLNFRTRLRNYGFFLAQIFFPFVGNALMIALLVKRHSEDEDVQEREKKAQEEVVSTGEYNSSEDDGERTDSKNLEDLKGLPKSSLLYTGSLSRLIALIFTFGLWALRADRWSESEITELRKNIQNKFSKENLQENEFYLCNDKEENLIAVTSGKTLKTFKIEAESKNISSYKEIEFSKVKSTRKNSSLGILDRETKKRIIEIQFQNSEDLSDFYKDLEAELNDEGLYEYRGVWDTKESIKEMKRADIGLKNNFQNFTPYEFEEFVADLLEEMGYRTRVTSKSGDFGVDVIAENRVERIAIQVKRHQLSNKVGAPAVQKTLGSIHKADADKTMIVTTSRFTGPALEQAEDGPIQLWDKEILHDQVEKNFINV